MTYQASSARKAARAAQTGRAAVLAIETSCDETAAAVVRDGRQVLSSAVYSQILLHRQYGGVVPELASRSHVEKLGTVVRSALEQSGLGLEELDAVAVTCGPGLVGALITGVSYAKGLALAKGLPLVGVHHIMGHISANYISHPDLEPPFLCLVASGGHSHLIGVKDYDKLRLLGKTVDDAAGEAFDKAARALGLPYPGGPELEKLARQGNAGAFKPPMGFNNQAHYDFSFSGLKTWVINTLHAAQQKGREVSKADIAAAFELAVTEVLSAKAVRAAGEFGYKRLCLAGGVAANTALRQGMADKAQKAGIAFSCPPTELCGDNGGMIGCAGYYLLMKGQISGLDLNALPDHKLGYV